MKKTIIALMALAGVAAADVTIGTYITKDSVNYDIVDTFAVKRMIKSRILTVYT